MIRLAQYLVLAAVTIVCPAIAAASGAIFGEWLALERKDGLGVAKTYTQNGGVQATYGALIDYRYKLAGKKLVLSSPPNEAIVRYVEINAAKLILTDLSGNRQKFTRISGDVRSGIIGKWTGDHHTGRKQVMHFTAAKNCYVSVPIVTEKGSYSLKADTLTEKISGKRTENWQCSIDNDVLTLTSPGKDKSEQYRRKE